MNRNLSDNLHLSAKKWQSQDEEMIRKKLVQPSKPVAIEIIRCPRPSPIKLLLPVAPKFHFQEDKWVAVLWQRMHQLHSWV